MCCNHFDNLLNKKKNKKTKIFEMFVRKESSRMSCVDLFFILFKHLLIEVFDEMMIRAENILQNELFNTEKGI